MSERVEQVNQLLKKEIGGYMQEHIDGGKGFLTITAVRTTPDLKLATVWLGYVGEDFPIVLKQIRKEKRSIQTFINKRLAMKSVPRIVFKHDNSGDYAVEISKKIEEAQANSESKGTIENN